MTYFCVFSSGSGSNFKELNKFSNNNNSKIKLKLLISNNHSCGAVNYAKKNNIQFKIFNSILYPNPNEYISKILLCLKQNKIDLIALAGYLKKIPDGIIEKYYRKILNIHPSLLPKFGGKGYYGMNVHKAVIASGEKKSGVTIHFIDKEYDKGPIIYQEEVPVLKSDTAEVLSSRILDVEHRVYKKVIRSLVNNNLKWIDEKIMVNEK